MLHLLVALDADMTVAEALDRLGRYDEAVRVAVRRRRRVDEAWWVLPQDEVRRRLVGGDVTRRVGEALALTSRPTAEARELAAGLADFEGLVLDHGVPVGWGGGPSDFGLELVGDPLFDLEESPEAARDDDLPGPAFGGGAVSDEVMSPMPPGSSPPSAATAPAGAAGARRDDAAAASHVPRRGAAAAASPAPATKPVPPREPVGDPPPAMASGKEDERWEGWEPRAPPDPPAAPGPSWLREVLATAAGAVRRAIDVPASVRGARPGAAPRPASAAASPSPSPPPPLVAAPSGPSPAAPQPRPAAFAVHPRLDSPREVVAGEAFDLDFALATLAPAAGAAPLAVALGADDDSFALDLQLVAGAFTAVDGLRRRLAGRRSRLDEARATFGLQAPERLAGAIEVATLRVQISQDGLLLGNVERQVAVRSPAAEPLAPAERERLAEREAPVEVIAGPGVPVPDLTVTVAKGGDAADRRYVLSFESPHALVRDREPLTVDLGQDAPTFAKQVMDEVKSTTGTPLLDSTLRGIGRMIGDRLPEPFWELLRDLQREAAADGRVLGVLWLSAESYVPWELARFPEPLLQPGGAPLLGAQVAFARWILGRPQPALPPAHRVAVEAMTVIVGHDYSGTRWWRDLEQAREEGESLRRLYGAHVLTATMREVDDLMELRHPERTEVIHFACHGQANPTTPSLSAILLAPDGRPLLPSYVLGCDRLGEEEHRPFVFLNACSVGTAGETLGEVAGFPGAFLRVGCRGFVAPLWEVKDDVAHRLALQLYADAFGDVPVAESLRRWRAGVDLHTNELEPTPLAYVFYGHPQLLLSRRRPAEGVEPGAAGPQIGGSDE